MISKKLNILIIEDEPDLASLIADYVHASGYQSVVIANGQSALERDWPSSDCNLSPIVRSLNRNDRECPRP